MKVIMFITGVGELYSPKLPMSKKTKAGLGIIKLKESKEIKIMSNPRLNPLLEEKC